MRSNKISTSTPSQSSPAAPAYVHQAFAEIAPRYALANHILSGGLDFYWRRYTAAAVAKSRPATILDVACGNGDLAFALQKKIPNAQITGLDFCQPMLDLAQSRGLQNTLCADVYNMPFSPASFDAITVAFGLRNFEDYPRALHAMQNALRPGGRLLILDFSLPKSHFFRTLYLFYLRRIMPTIGGWIAGHTTPYQYLHDSITTFPHGQSMLDLLCQCGFTQPSHHPLSLGTVALYTATKGEEKEPAPTTAPKAPCT